MTNPMFKFQGCHLSALVVSILMHFMSMQVKASINESMFFSPCQYKAR